MSRFFHFLSLIAILFVVGCSPKPTASESKSVGSNQADSNAAADGEGMPPIRVVGFDEDDGTLQGIIDGEVYGTIVQNPYMYGYRSVELLKELAEGKEPPTGDAVVTEFPARMIKESNAAEFWKDKNEKLAAGEGDDAFQEGRPSIAYVTNGIDPFWTIAAAGAKAAGREFNVNVLNRFPPKGVGDQKNMLEALLVQEDVTGIAVSPIDPANQQDILNKVGEAKHFITHDSDAPNTNRLAYIGMNNYDAGRLAGQMVKEAMPEGGSVMIFVGRLGQLNAEQRRQGLIDELLDRSHDETRRDPNDAVIEGDKYTILGTKLDNFDNAKAKQNAQDTITRYPDVGCMVGLFAYNPPLCLQAIREAGREVRPSSK